MYAFSYDTVPVDPTSGDVTLVLEACAIRVASGGVVVVQTRNGNVRNLTFNDGEVRPIFTGLIYQNGTTATGIEVMVSYFAIAPALATLTNPNPPNGGGGSPSGQENGQTYPFLGF